MENSSCLFIVVLTFRDIEEKKLFLSAPALLFAYRESIHISLDDSVRIVQLC